MAEYTSVGTIRWERGAVFFTPDGDHSVNSKKDKQDGKDGKDISSAVFVDEEGRGHAVPLTGGELELKHKSQDSAKFLAAAGGAIKVKIAIESASETKLEDTPAELVSVPAE